MPALAHALRGLFLQDCTMTGLDLTRAIAAHFGLPTAQVDAFNVRLHHGVGDKLAVTLTIELTPADLQGIGLAAADVAQRERRRVEREVDTMIASSNGILGRGTGIQ